MPTVTVRSPARGRRPLDAAILRASVAGLVVIADAVAAHHRAVEAAQLLRLGTADGVPREQAAERVQGADRRLALAARQIERLAGRALVVRADAAGRAIRLAAGALTEIAGRPHLAGPFTEVDLACMDWRAYTRVSAQRIRGWVEGRPGDR